MACRTIAAGIGGDVCTLEVGGVFDYAYIANRDDIDTFSRSANPMLITNLTMKTGKVLYKINGVKGSIKPGSTLVKGTYKDFYQHRLRFAAFKNDPDTMKVLSDMDGADLVAFVFNNNKSIEILGLEVGMEKMEQEREYQNRDSGLVSDVLLQTANEDTKSMEVYPPLIYRNIDYATSKAQLDGFLAPDTTAPLLTSAGTNTGGTIINLQYDETLDSGSVPAIGDFTTSPAKTISGVSISGDTVSVTVSAAFLNTDTITISYVPGTNKIRDMVGNTAAALSSEPVTNNVV